MSFGEWRSDDGISKTVHISPAVKAEDADTYVLGYSPLITITDSSFGDILVGPCTNQEKGLPLVYGRWADGFNTMLENREMYLFC